MSHNIKFYETQFCDLLGVRSKISKFWPCPSCQKYSILTKITENGISFVKHQFSQPDGELILRKSLKGDKPASYYIICKHSIVSHWVKQASPATIHTCIKSCNKWHWFDLIILIVHLRADKNLQKFYLNSSLKLVNLQIWLKQSITNIHVGATQITTANAPFFPPQLPT